MRRHRLFPCSTGQGKETNKSWQIPASKLDYRNLQLGQSCIRGTVNYNWVCLKGTSKLEDLNLKPLKS